MMSIKTILKLQNFWVPKYYIDLFNYFLPLNNPAE